MNAAGNGSELLKVKAFLISLLQLGPVDGGRVDQSRPKLIAAGGPTGKMTSRLPFRPKAQALAAYLLSVANLPWNHETAGES